jgi:hypothetical protein
MTTRKIRTTIVVLFAWTMIGADGSCNGWWTASTPPQASNKPFCLFDPPVGCKAYCPAVGTIDFTPQCDDISSSTLTVAFKNTVGQRAVQAMVNGVDICTQNDVDIMMSLNPCRSASRRSRTRLSRRTCA